MFDLILALSIKLEKKPTTEHLEIEGQRLKDTCRNPQRHTLINFQIALLCEPPR